MNEEQAKLIVRVHPGSSTNSITGYADGVLSIKITARPEKGKANEALVKYLGDILGIAKSRIEVQKGSASRNKIIVIEGISTSDAISFLTAPTGGKRSV